MKKLYTLISVILTAAVLLTACQPTPDTPPVVSKNDGTLEDAIVNGAPDGYVYEVPENYSKSVSLLNGRLNISMDETAQITAKKGIIYPVYEATIANFDTETIKHIARVFFGDAQLVSHNTTVSKDRILNEVILPLQQRISEIENGSLDPTVDENGNTIIDDFTGKPVTAEQELESLRFYLERAYDDMEKAPDSVDIKYLSLDDYNPGNNFNADCLLPDGKTGRLCITGNVLTINRNYEESGFLDRDGEYGGIIGDIDTFMSSNADIPDDYISNKPHNYYVEKGLDYDNAISQAVDFVAELGLDEYSYSGIGVSHNFGMNTVETEATVEQTFTKYGVIFMRTVGDSICIPDLYYYANGQVNNEDGETQFYPSFHYERLVVWVGTNGVESMYWSSPLKVERELQSSVELIPFETLVEKSLFKSYTNEYDPKDYYETIYTDFELGYSMMKEKNKEGYFILIPTWFVSFKTNNTVYSDETETEITYELSQVFFRADVINAIDGSRINRDLGY